MKQGYYQRVAYKGQGNGLERPARQQVIVVHAALSTIGPWEASWMFVS